MKQKLKKKENGVVLFGRERATEFYNALHEGVKKDAMPRIKAYERWLKKARRKNLDGYRI